jgi:cell wall-associated NlpC family hydrolase
MRRLPVVFVLLATIAAGWAKAAWSQVNPPTSRARPGHAATVQRLASEVVDYARDQLGVRYSWGGTSRATGFDCSGLVYAAYRSIGWKIPRSLWDQLRAGRPVGFAGLRPGDLLFSEGGGHVQLVVSGNAAISAPQTGERVHYVPLAELRSEFAGARRLIR